MNKRKKKNVIKLKLPLKWSFFGLVMGVVLATVGSVGALNGWFGGGGSSIPEDTLTRGLVGYWPFEEGSGSLAHDSSNYTNTGTLTSGPSWTKGKVGGALSFDGTDDNVTIPDSATYDVDIWTIEFWMWRPAYTGGRGVFSKNDFNTAAGYGVYFGGSELVFIYGDGTSGNSYLSYPFASITSGWHHWVWTRSGANHELFLDGVSVNAKADGKTGSVGNNTQLYLGNIPVGYENAQFDGKLDELRIYNRVLSAEEIRYHYNKGGPVAQWTFDEGSGTTAYDSSNNSNDGTISGATWTTGKYGSALSFDGTNDYVQASDSSTLDITSAITMSAWVKGPNTNPEWAAIVDKGDCLNSGGYNIRISGTVAQDAGPTGQGYLNFIIWNGATYKTVNSATKINDNTWHYVTGVFNGTTGKMTVYVDGKAETSYNSGLSAMTTNNNNITIGFPTTCASRYFNGLIDDVRIYNYARTPEEIRLDYNSGFAARFGGSPASCGEAGLPAACMNYGLVGYWPFEEGSGTIAHDQSDYANNGTWAGTGSHWTNGKVGGAGQFDGTDDYVDAGTGTSLQITGQMTAEAWYKWDGSATNKPIISKDTLANRGWSLWGISSASTFYGAVFIGGAAKEVFAGTPQANTWYHLVMTFDTVNLRLFQDGKLIGTTAAAGSQDNNSGNKVIIGATYNGTAGWFPGLIDEVRIYNRALSAEEVRYHYNRGGPVAHWKFDEGEGRTAYDSTDNNNDGTLQLAPSGNTATSTAWVTGKHGTALSFDGVDDYVDAGNASLFALTKWTIGAWVYRQADSGTYERLVTKGNSGNADMDYHFQITDVDVWRGGFRDTDGNLRSVDTTLTVPLNKWVYGVTTFDGTYVRVYVNGNLEAMSGDFSSVTHRTGTGNLWLGRLGSNYSFNGLIDDVRIYNYARTPDEIRLDYNQGFAAHIGSTYGNCKDDPGSCMTQGLVGYWPLEEGSGTLAHDSSDYANTGTLVGPSWAKGKVGGALSFDGTDDYVDAGNGASLNVGAEITIEAWIKPNSVTGFHDIVTKIYPTPRSYVLLTNGTEIYSSIYISDAVGTDHTSSGCGLAIGQWTHVVNTYGGGYGKIYCNGILVGTDAQTGNIQSSPSTPVTIGYQEPDWARYFDGLIDEAKIYNRALSVEEIRYHYNRGAPVAHWKFDEGEGRTAYDSTDNNNDGTLQLAPAGNTATSSAWVAGKYGSALSFDGVDDYVDIGDTSQTTVKTISLWLKANDTTSRKIIDIDGTDQIELDANSQITATSFPGTVTYYLNGIANSRIITADTWYHVVITDTTGVNASNMDIGRVSTGYFDGIIDDVRIYNYARTPSQILQDYNAGLSVHFR